MQFGAWAKAHSVGMRRVAWLVLAVVVFYGLAWLAVPPLVRSQVQKHGSEALGRQLSIAQVKFNPFTLELEVKGLTVAGPDGKEPQLQVERVYANAAIESVWRLAPVIDALEIDVPKLRMAQTAPGVFDFDDILQRFQSGPGAEPAQEPLHFALYNVQLQGGAVDFDDQVVGAKHTLNDITLNLPFLSNLPADREIKVVPRLAFEFDGSPFDTSAQATPFAETHQAQVRLLIQDFDLAPLAPYVPASLGVKLDSATLNADLGLSFTQQAKAPQVSLSGSLKLSEVGVSDADRQKLITVGGLNVTLGDVRPLEHQVEIASIEVQAPHLYLRRDASGRVHLPGGTSETASPEPSSTSAPAASPWNVAIRQVQVADGALDWRDESLHRPDAETLWQVRDWQAEVRDAVWPTTQPAQFNSALRLGAAAGGEPARLEVQGEVSASALRAHMTASDIAVALAAPYLAQYIRPTVAGTLNIQASVEGEGDALTLKVERLQLSKASLTCAARKGCPTLREAGATGARRGEQLALGQLELADATIDLQRHKVQVGRLTLDAPQVLVARDKSGAWMFDDWLIPAPATPATHEEASAAWTAAVREVQLKNGAVWLRDAGASEPVALHLSSLEVGLRDLAWEGDRLPAFGLRVKTRMGTGKADPGQLDWDGTVALSPELAIKGRLRSKDLPLHVVQAYLPDELNVDVVRADGDFAGDVNLSQGKQGLSVAVQGDAALSDVQVRLKPEGESKVANQGEAGDLLRWKTLSLRGLALALQPEKPLALDVRETALSDFFARVIVQENGRINLQDIGRAANDDAPQEGAPSTETAAQQAPRIHFGPVALVNGTVDFTDHFIKPNYSANLTELTGSLSAFSSVAAEPGAAPQLAQLELKGRAQGTALLEISGQVNPLAQPLALDIQGHMRDLELPPLSPYSVKYAGHGIERGKLSVDVAYKVQPDGQLTASNKLVLKQLAFGDEVKGAPNSLPVRLAVALLADRNGVIDVDLPISGSLNDPEFSLGPVIMKVIGNLIMKAITAPFSLLAHALGGGDENGDVAFDPGSSRLSAKTREQLDAMAKALVDRPALKATVVGWANPETELQGYKQQRLTGMLLAEKRREAVDAGKDATQVSEVAQGEVAPLLKRVYQRADNIKKPRNVIGMAKDIPSEEMEKLLLTSIVVPDNAMQELALARAVAVRDHLAAQHVPMDRLFIGASKLAQPAGEAKEGAPRVQLQLGAD